VECIEEEISSYKVWWKTPKKRGHLEYQSVDGRIILKLASKTWDKGHRRTELVQDRER